MGVTLRQDRHPAAQIRDSKHGMVAAIGGTDQVEELLVLRGRQQLTIAKGPSQRRGIAGEDHDLTDKRARHPVPHN